MPIRMTTPEAEIRRRLEQEVERIGRAVERALAVVGEKAVRHARSLPSPNAADFPTYPKIPRHQPHYIDWTANLRSSIGYVVIRDGHIVTEGGYTAISGGKEGARTGRDYARSLAAEFPRGYALVVTAGMEYAGYVADKGYDVIDSAGDLAGRLADELLRKIARRGAGGDSHG